MGFRSAFRCAFKTPVRSKIDQWVAGKTGHSSLKSPETLERFQEKWMPLFRLENATKQRLRAFVLMQSKRETL